MPHNGPLSNLLMIESSDFCSDAVKRCSKSLFRSTDLPSSWKDQNQWCFIGT